MWHQYCLVLEQSGDMQAIDKLLYLAIDRPYEPELFHQSAEKVTHCPEDSAIRAYILEKYPSHSFHQLPPDQMQAAAEGYSIQHVADLCWLFSQNVSPLIYNRYRRAVNKGLIKQIALRAGQYAMSNRDDPDFMMDLDRYLDPQNPGWRKRIRNFNRERVGKSGLNDRQAGFLKVMQQNGRQSIDQLLQ